MDENSQNKFFRFSVLVLVVAIIVVVVWFAKINKQEQEYYANHRITSTLGSFEKAYGGRASSDTQEKLDKLDKEKNDIDNSKSNLWIFIGVSFAIVIVLITLENKNNILKLNTNIDAQDRLKKLEDLKRDNLITEDEYQKVRATILENLEKVEWFIE